MNAGGSHYHLNNMLDELHWEHGYRCHGLWHSNGKRVALIGIGPRATRQPSDGYAWSIDGTNVEGKASTLRLAKKAVLHFLLNEAANSISKR
jgi:hypothetical protein